MTSNTRFRAYQLDKAGSPMSYYDGSTFTLIEAILDSKNWPTLYRELYYCKDVKKIDTLHITSWDGDHCCEKDLRNILIEFNPTVIEYPKYEPHTENGRKCLSIILEYVHKHTDTYAHRLDPAYIRSLNNAQPWGTNNIIYNTGEYATSNDNSSVKFFRSGKFNVLSLGDIDSSEIANSLMKNNILRNEVDILILSHHGAAKGVNTDEFIKAIKPRVAICTSDFGNEYEHPKQSVRDMLTNNNIPLYTTKTGDIIIESTFKNDPFLIRLGYRVPLNAYTVHNLQSNSTEVSSSKSFFVKRRPAS